MTHQSFISIAASEVKALTEKYQVPDYKAFILFFCKSVFDLDDEDALEDLILDSSNDKGIDLIWIDDRQEKVIVAQGKYSLEGKSKPSGKDIDSFFSCLNWLATPDLLKAEGKDEIAEKAKEYLASIENGYTIELWFVYFGQNSNNIEKSIQAFNANRENQERNRRAINCDINLLHSLYDEYRGNIKRIEKHTISALSDCFEISGVFGRGIVTTIKANELISLHKKFDNSLFSRDVRLWLGSKKGSVNAGIINTLNDKKEREYFWAYNNGITIICDKYEYDRNKRQIVLYNFSVVNGCQTTSALTLCEESVNDKVLVLIRIISPPEETINSIIRFNNSQNQIRPWDIVTLDPLQTRLKEEFEKSLKKPYYYQLRRGDLNLIRSDEKKKFKEDGRMRIIRHDLLTQYLSAFRQDPYTAYKHKSILFTDKYGTLFNRDIRVEELLFVWKIGELIRESIIKRISKTDDTNNQLVILKRGGKFYVVAVFGFIARLRNGENISRNISEERIESIRAVERIKKYTELSIVWYIEAVNYILKETSKDLSVLVREPAFYDQVKERVHFNYSTFSINKDWLKGGLPPLIT
jgi:hypothetical protein